MVPSAEARERCAITGLEPAGGLPRVIRAHFRRFEGFGLSLLTTPNLRLGSQSCQVSPQRVGSSVVMPNLLDGVCRQSHAQCLSRTLGAIRRIEPGVIVIRHLGDRPLTRTLRVQRG